MNIEWDSEGIIRPNTAQKREYSYFDTTIDSGKLRGLENAFGWDIWAVGMPEKVGFHHSGIELDIESANVPTLMA